MSANPSAAVVFDMDGIIIDSEEHWQRARLALVAEFGGTYHAGVEADVMGMSPPEWAHYLRANVGVPLPEARIMVEVGTRLAAEYRRERPFFPGAIDCVRAIAARWPTGLASASGRDLIDLVVELAGLRDVFVVTVSGAEVGRGKPAPDVYLAALERLGAQPRQSVAIEDSSNGIRAGKNAGMRVVAIPNPVFPPSADALALADRVLPRIAELTPEVIADLLAGPG